MNKFINYVLSRQTYFVIVSLVIALLNSGSALVGSYARATSYPKLSILFVLLSFIANALVVILLYCIWKYRADIVPLLTIAGALNLVKSTDADAAASIMDKDLLASIRIKSPEYNLKYLTDIDLMEAIWWLKALLDGKCVLCNVFDGEELHCILPTHITDVLKYLSKLVDESMLEEYVYRYTTLARDSIDEIVLIDMLPIIDEVNAVLAANQLGKMTVSYRYLDGGEGSYQVVYTT